MKKIFSLALMAAFMMIGSASADLISGFGVTATQDFDSYAGTAATVPTDFAFTDGDYSPGGIYDASGAYSNSNSNYALVFGDDADRAFGSKRSSGGGDFLNWTITNGTGTAIETFLITWDVEQYSAGGRATTIDMNYNSNDGGFTQAGITGTTLTTGITGANENLSAVMVTSRSVTLEPTTPLQNGESILIGFSINHGAGSGSNGHIGVDNITVTAVPEPSSIALLGLVGLAGAVRRRK